MKNHTSKEAYFARLRNLADVNKTPLKESKGRALGTLIDYKRAADGIAYGIIKENHHYYVKKGGLKQDPNVSDFTYIGGLGNVTEFQYKSLAEADKQRNMLFHTINEAVSLRPNKNGSKSQLFEDKAGDEIDNAESKLGDLDAATSAEQAPAPETGDDEMAAGLEAMPADAAPEGGEVPAEMPAPEGGEAAPEGGEVPAEEPAPEGGEVAPEGGEAAPEGDAAADLEATLGGEEGGDEVAPEGGEEVAPEGGDETAPEGGEEVAPEGGDETAPEGDDPSNEIKSKIGKLGQTVKRTELTDEMTLELIGEFLGYWKSKLKNIDVDLRKKLADKHIIALKSEEEKDMDAEELGQNVEDTEKAAGIEEPVAEAQCAECGSFAMYAESMGYGSAEALMECGEEEVTNLISNYGNHHMDGMNDGDAEGVATVIKVINPEILNKLRGDYGHDEYAEKLTPYVNGLSECSQEEGVQKLEELFGGLKALGQKAGQAVGGAIQKGAQAVKTGAQNVAQTVGGAVKSGAQAVGQAAQNVGQAVKAGAQNVAQTYHSGEVAGEVKKLEGLANNLGQQIAALNTRLQKAGQQPVDANKLLAGITNQLKAGKTAAVAGTKAGGALAEENDPASVETQPDIKFAGPQSLGGGVVKPEGAPIKMAESEEKLRKYIRQRLQEKAGLRKSSLQENKKSPTLKKLDSMIDEQFKLYESVMKKK